MRSGFGALPSFDAQAYLFTWHRLRYAHRTRIRRCPALDRIIIQSRLKVPAGIAPSLVTRSRMKRLGMISCGCKKSLVVVRSRESQSSDDIATCLKRGQEATAQVVLE